MQVIRIESPNTGEGIFGNIRKLRTLNIYNRLARIHHKKDFPGPKQDKELMDIFIEGTHYFAFNNLYQFNKGFPKKELNILIQNGFKVYMLELTEAIQSQYQTIFELNNIKSKIDITNLFIITL